VLTDIAAKGLELENVKHVINYSLPREVFYLKNNFSERKK